MLVTGFACVKFSFFEPSTSSFCAERKSSILVRSRKMMDHVESYSPKTAVVRKNDRFQTKIFPGTRMTMVTKMDRGHSKFPRSPKTTTVSENGHSHKKVTSDIRMTVVTKNWLWSPKMAMVTKNDPGPTKIAAMTKNDRSGPKWRRSPNAAAVTQKWPSSPKMAVVNQTNTVTKNDRVHKNICGQREWSQSPKFSAVTKDDRVHKYDRGQKEWPRPPNMSAVTKNDHGEPKWPQSPEIFRSTDPVECIDRSEENAARFLSSSLEWSPNFVQDSQTQLLLAAINFTSRQETYLFYYSGPRPSYYA